VFVLVSCARLSWSHSAFESTLNSCIVSYRIMQHSVCIMQSAQYAIVSLSITRMDQSKMVGIMQFSPYSSPVPLILLDKFHPDIMMGSPRVKRQTWVGWSMTVNDLELLYVWIFSEFCAISQIWEATTVRLSEWRYTHSLLSLTEL